MRWWFLILCLVVTGVLSGATEADKSNINILVVFHSPGGHTRDLAEAIAAGARFNPAVQVELRSVEKAKIADVIRADAIILGCPVYNANVTPELQSFINSWPFESGVMRDKIGAAFTTGGGISAGQETVQLTILREMLIFGMVVVGGADWKAAFGASGVTEEGPFKSSDGDLADDLHPVFLEKARNLGVRVAELVVKVKGVSSDPDNTSATRRESKTESVND